MKVKLWGTRAQIPAPHPDTQGDGGNTICLEIAEEIVPTLILDAGMGLRWLGNDLLKGAYGRGEGNGGKGRRLWRCGRHCSLCRRYSHHRPHRRRSLLSHPRLRRRYRRASHQHRHHPRTRRAPRRSLLHHHSLRHPFHHAPRATMCHWSRT